MHPGEGTKSGGDWKMRKSPPSRRKSERYKRRWLRNALFIDVGRYEDGSPCEVFVSSARQGSETLDLFGAIGILASLALQYGVPAGKIAHAMRGFAPDTFPTILADVIKQPAPTDADPTVTPDYDGESAVK